jgi:hypothetical protein
MWEGWEAELTRRIGKVTSEKQGRRREVGGGVEKKKGIDDDLWLVLDGHD